MQERLKVNSAPQEWLDEYETFPKSVQTMQDFYLWTDKKYGSNKYLGRFRPDMSIEWKTRHEIHMMALKVGTKLVELGIPAGSRIGVYSENSIEAVVFLEAAQLYGYIIIFSFDAHIYSYPGFVYHDSECSCLYVSPHKMNSISKITPNEMKSLKFIIAKEIPDLEDERFSCLKKIKIYSFDEFTTVTGELAALPEVLPSTINTICYSSGTAGAPKGVILSHRAILYGAYNVLCAVDIRSTTVHLSFLPLAHILERVTLNCYTFRGAMVVFARNSSLTALEDMAACHENGGPHIPSIVERMLQGVKSRAPPFLLNACLSLQKFMSFFGLRSRVSDLVLFNKAQKKLGGCLEWFVVAGDSFSKDTQEEIAAILNINIIQIYGLSECAGAVSICNRRDTHAGNCGCCAPNLEIKFGDRNEVYVKSPTNFDGYWKNEEITAETIVDGWVRTGDKGGVDKYGNLLILGRTYNMFEYKPGRELAIPFICFTYKKCRLCDDIYIEYFKEGRCLIAIAVVPKGMVEYALTTTINSDEQYLQKANSRTFTDWSRSYLRSHARNNDLNEVPYIGALRCINKPFDQIEGLLTQTGKQRPQMFRQHFQPFLNDMKDEVIQRRKRKNIDNTDIMEYSDEGKESEDEEDN